MDNRKYYLWLQDALGIGFNSARVFGVFDSPAEIFKSSEMELKLSGVFNTTTVEKLMKFQKFGTSKYDEQISKSEDENISVLTPTCEGYPSRLLELDDYPIVLYTKGDQSILNDPLSLAIVGTRKPLASSVVLTEAIARALASAGFVIVSGGALGIDTAAHVGTLCSGGKTICVLGCGINSDYLSSQKPLRAAVAKDGLLVSELPPGTPPVKYTFPKRNRIIAGLTLGTLVVDAGIKSGSLITAKAAYSYGKDVFAVAPLEIGSANEGCVELLRDGAIEVKCAFDIVREYLPVYAQYIDVENSVDLFLEVTKGSLRENLGDYGVGFDSYKSKLASGVVPEINRKGKKGKEDLINLSEYGQKVLPFFSKKPISVNELADKVNCPMNVVLGTVTELELAGYIEMLPNAKYILKWEG